MSIMTIEEYCEHYPGNQAEYAKSLAEPPKGTFPPSLVTAGMIHWHKDPQIWAGPFEGNYAFFKLVNYNTQTDLPTTDELDARKVKSELYSTFNIEARDLLKIFGLKDRYFIQTCNEGHKYSRSQMTHEELMHARKELGEDWFNDHTALCIERCTQYPLSKIMPCKETPYMVYLCGNDNTSYSAFFTTQEEAGDAIDRFESYPDVNFLYDRFTFTN